MKDVSIIAGMQLFWIFPMLFLLGFTAPEVKQHITHIPLAEAQDSEPGHFLSCDEKKPQRVKVGVHRLTVHQLSV